MRKKVIKKSVKKSSDSVPFSKIASGIRLTYESCLTQYHVGSILLKNKEYNNASVHFVLAQEEFGQIIFLLEWYEKSKDISKKMIRENLKDHSQRLKNSFNISL